MSRLIPLFAFAVLSAGCVPVTEPLSDPMKSEPDKRLVGKWGAVEIDIPAVKGHPKGLMRAVMDGQPANDQNAFWFFPTTIGKHTYATVYLASGGDLKFTDFRKEGAFEAYHKGKDQAYFIFKYTIDGDTLVVDGGKESAVGKLMADAKIERPGSSLFFKTPAGWLAQHFKKNDPDAIYDGSNTQKHTREKK